MKNSLIIGSVILALVVLFGWCNADIVQGHEVFHSAIVLDRQFVPPSYSTGSYVDSFGNVAIYDDSIPAKYLIVVDSPDLGSREFNDRFHFDSHQVGDATSIRDWVGRSGMLWERKLQ